MFNKPLLLALIVCLSLCGLFGYLSYSFYGKYSVATQRLDVAVEANDSLQKAIEKQRLACVAADVASTEYQAEKAVKDKETSGLVGAVDSLPKKPVKQVETDNETHEIDIDSKLPTELVRMLQQAFRSAE